MGMAVTDSDIVRVSDWDSLVEVSHAMAVDKDWWRDGKESRPLDEITNNFHSEVSEAWEEFRAGRIDTWHNGSPAAALAAGSLPKPEGFWVEIADLLIRMADAAGAHRVEIGDIYDCGCHEDYRAFINSLHVDLVNREYGQVLHSCFAFAAENDRDLWSTIVAKLRYNATRPSRHGGKRA